MSIHKSLGRLALFSGLAAGVALTTPGSAFAAEDGATSPDAGTPLTGENGHGLALPSHGESTGHALDPGQGLELPTPNLHDGWVEFGDSRPSATESQQRGSDTKSPPPNRADAGPIPRAGAGIKPSDLDARWSYDFTSPADTGAVTRHVPVPYPTISNAVPGELGPVDNQAFVLKEDNRTADGPRRKSTVSDPKWNLTTTDANVPGAGRVYRFDMVCPDHAGRHGHGEHDEVYTGASDFNLGKGHQVFSYHWGDPAFNNGFVLAHYLAYGLSNTPPEHQQTNERSGHQH